MAKGNGISICSGLDGSQTCSLPEDPQPSIRLRKRFNDVAKELGIGLEWTKDDQDFLVVNPDEVLVKSEFLAKYGLKEKILTLFNPQLTRDIRNIFSEVERQRLDAVNKSALIHKRISYRAPLENLNKAEQKAVELFQAKVKSPLSRIEARQHDPHAPELNDYMVDHGDYYSKILFSRFHKDNCAGPFVADEKCSLFPFFPDQAPINGMIAPTISMEEFQALGAKLPVNAEELRPTTILSKDAQGKIISTPIPLDAAFKSDHLELAKALDEIASLSIGGDHLDPGLSSQLKKWAQFFRTGDAQDEAAAAQATIDAGESGGMLRVHLGPSESYWDDNTKFPYLLQVGVRDPKLVAELAHGKGTFLELEKSLSDIQNYKPRELSSRGGFADPIYQAITGGFIESFPIREPAGNNFPNYEGYKIEGSNRFILLDALLPAISGTKTVMGRLFDEDFSKWNAEKYIIRDVVDHESGHLLGPQRGHITPSGQKMGAVFGKHWGSADEAKADLTASQRVRVDYEAGRLSEAEAKNYWRASMSFHMGNRYKGKAAFDSDKLTDHYYGHMIQVGQYFKTGALTLVSVHGEKKLHIDYKKMSEVSTALWRTIISFQASGNLEGFLKLGKTLVASIPEEADKMILEAGKDQPISFVERHL